MKVEITPQKLKGEILVPYSKSYSHRHLIASFLANSIYRGSYLHSNDILETINVLNTLSNNFDDVEIELFFGKSASTLRFLIPILLLTNKTYILHMNSELSKRPLDVYEDLFLSNIVFKKLNNTSILIKGPLSKNTFEIDGSVSSQFISGLLFALPLQNKDSKIILKTKLVSKSYVDMTIEVLKNYNIEIEETSYGYFIKGNQKYKPFLYEIERDFSQAAFWFVAGTINAEIRLLGLNPESIQGDKKIIEIINQAGGNIKLDNNHYVVFPKKTRGFKVDLDNIPDLGPILFVLAAFSEGVSEFTNINRLIIKESDRLNKMIEVLNSFGVKTNIIFNKLFIEGTNNLKGDITLSSYDDHRILMAIFILASRATNKVIVHNLENINKSYPDFLDDYVKLGGKFNVIK